MDTKKAKPLLLLCCAWILGIGLLYFTRKPLVSASFAVMIICIGMALLTKKSKPLAIALALIPFIPANRIYIGDMQWDTVIIRLIPMIGSAYDLYMMLISKKLKPSTGWTNKLYEQ